MRIVSHLSRAIRKLGLSNTQFADQAGVARSTIQKLIGQDFKEIRVDTLERIAARLKVTDINELFSLQDDSAEFLAPFEASRSVTFVFGTHEVTDAPSARRGTRPESALRTSIDVWDFRAQTLFLNHVRQRVPDLRDEILFFSHQSFGAEERAQVLELVERQNVVVIGSPKVNPAAEVMVRELFPGTRKDPANLEKGPPLRLAEGAAVEASALLLHDRARSGVVHAANGGMVARAEYRGSGRTSLDAGVLLAAYRPRRTSENVLLMIAAGISGCGTYGVIQGLIEHPPKRRELEPGEPWMRAYQTYYSKPTDLPRDDRFVDKVEVAEAAAGG